MIPRRALTAGALALAAAPFAARAQQAPQKTHRVAIFISNHRTSEIAEDGPPFCAALLKELRRLGFVEGQNLILHRFGGEGCQDRYAEIAREVVSTRPDLVSGTL